MAERTRLLLLGALAVAAVVAVVVVSGGGSHRGVLRLNRTTFTDAITPAEATHDQVVILQYSPTVHALVGAIHRAHPGVIVLFYQDPKLARPSDVHGYTVCETAPQAAAAPGWFLTDAAGQEVAPPFYSTDRLLDVGDGAYQRACAAHALALAIAPGRPARENFDGVYIDDLNADITTSLPAGVSCLHRSGSPGCETNAQWQAAMLAMDRYLAGQLHAHHLLAFGNIGSSWNYPGLWQRWAAPLDGAQEQSYASAYPGNAEPAESQWRAQVADEAWSEAHHRYDVLASYANTEAGNTFGLASMLLAADGYTSWSVSDGFGAGVRSYPEYTAAARLGAPRGRYTATASGAATVYRRRFDQGIVLVNPTGQPSGAVRLGGIYSGSGQEPARTGVVVLAPHSGLILRRP